MRRTLALAVAGAVGCGGEEASSPEVLAALPDVVASAPAPDGALLLGQRASGRIWRRAPGGGVRPLVRVPVARRGQRGLLGLVAGPGARVLAAWTTRGGRLVVGQVLPRRTVLWRGPRTADLANGGHLARREDGRLLVSVGDRQGARRSGVVLLLGPRGRLRAARALSRGWNNPFAFDVTPAGRVWVADNAPGREPERLGRGDRGRPRAVAELPARTAASGLAALGEERVAVCGYVSRRLLLYDVSGPRPRLERELAGDCRLGVAALPGGRLAYSTGRDVRVLTP